MMLLSPPFPPSRIRDVSELLDRLSFLYVNDINEGSGALVKI